MTDKESGDKVTKAAVWKSEGAFAKAKKEAAAEFRKMGSSPSRHGEILSLSDEG
jgi:hypothetical protein